MQHSKLITLEAYAARRDYIRQWNAYHRDPDSNPEPDHGLRLIGATHGPITGVRLDRDPRDGAPVAAVSYHKRNDRYFDMLDEVALELGLGFGGGLSIRHTGKGLAYPALRVKRPKGRAIYVPRLLMDAPRWTVSKQQAADGSRQDYHWLRRRDLSPTSVRTVWQEGKQSRVPEIGRAAFLEAAALYCAENQAEACIAVSAADHVALIKDALRIGDERHAAYLKATE